MTVLTFMNRALATLDEGRIHEVLIGVHWTAVVAEVDGERRCGLASTVHTTHDHKTDDVPAAGCLQAQGARELAALIYSRQPLLASVGLATINALLTPPQNELVTMNAEDVIAGYGAGKKVALVGHFPFVPRLLHQVGKLSVLEQHPRPGDLPAIAAPSILTNAEVVALTSMTIHNHTLPDLLSYSNPQALVILLGPSTPLTPVLFDEGIDILCGSVVTDIDAVMRVVAQGGNFRQVHRAGVRTVTLVHPDLKKG